MGTQRTGFHADRRLTLLILAVFALTLGGVAPGARAAADWVSIARTDRTEVFANPASLGVSPASWVIVRTRQNFVEPQPSAKKDKPYLSARNEYRVDCAQRRLAYRELEAYSQLELRALNAQRHSPTPFAPYAV